MFFTLHSNNLQDRVSSENSVGDEKREAREKNTTATLGDPKFPRHA